MNTGRMKIRIQDEESGLGEADIAVGGSECSHCK